MSMPCNGKNVYESHIRKGIKNRGFIVRCAGPPLKTVHKRTHTHTHTHTKLIYKNTQSAHIAE
jgi:hypothetical protein